MMINKLVVQLKNTLLLIYKNLNNTVFKINYFIIAILNKKLIYHALETTKSTATSTTFTRFTTFARFVTFTMSNTLAT